MTACGSGYTSFVGKPLASVPMESRFLHTKR